MKKKMDIFIFSFYLIFIKEAHSLSYTIVSNLQPHM